MLWSRVYRRRGEMVLALADEELMGKRFEEGELVLEVGKFYMGEKIEEEKAEELVKKATIINAVGERAVKAVIRAGMAREEHVRKIAGIPHIQVVLYFI